jgi:epidermal growth factor receptor kinase substrate 8
MMSEQTSKRNELIGPVYEVQHLATFTVGSKHGLLRADDGMRKLRLMERSQGVWTMDCEIMIDKRFLVILDKKTGVIVNFIYLFNLLNSFY